MKTDVQVRKLSRLSQIDLHIPAEQLEEGMLAIERTYTLAEK